MRDGRIPTVRRGGRKLIDPALADVAWRENTDASKPRGPRDAFRGNGASPPAPGTQAAENLELTRTRRIQAQLDLDHSRGLLVNAAEVEHRAFDRAKAAQKALLSIPARLPLTEAQRQLVRAELLAVCEMLAGEASPEAAQPEADRAVASS